MPPYGITPNDAIAGTAAITGAIRCITRLAPIGTTSSLVSSLRTSASGCRRPRTVMPAMSARFAPMRSCITALCLRSIQVITGANAPTAIAMMKSVLISAATSTLRPCAGECGHRLRHRLRQRVHVVRLLEAGEAERLAEPPEHLALRARVEARLDRGLHQLPPAVRIGARA